MALHSIRQKSAAVAAVAGLGAVLVGCGSNNLPNTQTFGAAATPAPMSIVCEPMQRAVVRQVVVNGVMQAQAECVSTASMVGTTGQISPVTYGQMPGALPSYSTASYVQPVLDDTRLVRTAYPAERVVTRQAAPQRVVYQPARRVVETKPARSVKKSAIIIGSSAGVGAGIGAAVGGKKGAGIGALIGGGGAALWDQITRR